MNAKEMAKQIVADLALVAPAVAVGVCLALGWVGRAASEQQVTVIDPDSRPELSVPRAAYKTPSTKGPAWITFRVIIGDPGTSEVTLISYHPQDILDAQPLAQQAIDEWKAKQ